MILVLASLSQFRTFEQKIYEPSEVRANNIAVSNVTEPLTSPLLLSRPQGFLSIQHGGTATWNAEMHGPGKEVGIRHRTSVKDDCQQFKDGGS